jgi:hypothetical protein
MDGPGRMKLRPGVSKQDVCERRANPVVPKKVFEQKMSFVVSEEGVIE